MHGLTAAESVLTNPDFLSKVLSGGLRDAEAVREAEQRNVRIDAALGEIRAMNDKIAEKNQSLLDAWGLKATEIESLTTGTLADGPGTDAPAGSEAFDAFTQQMADLGELAAEIKYSASRVLTYGQFVLSKRDELQLTAPQEETLNSLNQFAQRIVASLDVPVDQVELEHEAAEAARQTVKEFQWLVARCAEAKTQSAALMQRAQQLLDEGIDETVVREARDFAADVVKTIATWGQPPSVAESLFES
jgi:hypothetical protein